MPGVLISSRFTVKVPDMTIRGGLGGILIISGLKLLNVPEANWVLGGGLVLIAGRPDDLHGAGDAERVARRSRTRLTALQLR